MTTKEERRSCSICNKYIAKYSCIGCNDVFCSKDFKEHNQNLSIRFDNEVVTLHDDIKNQIRSINESSVVQNFFHKVERWRQTTIEQVEKTAENIRLQLTELIDERKIMLMKSLESMTKEINLKRREENFLEHDIEQLKSELGRVKDTLEKLVEAAANTLIVINNDEIDWNSRIYIQKRRVHELCAQYSCPSWTTHGVTVTQQAGHRSNEACKPYGLCIDDDQTIYVAEWSMHRIVEWRRDVKGGRVVAGGNGQGKRSDQLNNPTDVIIDKTKHCLIIADYGNKRIVQWLLASGDGNGKTLVTNIECWGLALDKNHEFLYVTNFDKHEVLRFKIGENHGVVVAGGHGLGNRLDQLNSPTYILVDHDDSIYVADSNNHRVVKWIKALEHGIIVAGGQGQGNGFGQLSFPKGILVNKRGTLYVADHDNHRIMRWPKASTQGEIIIGNTGHGERSNQLHHPTGLEFDFEGNLYVSDTFNHRIQKFYYGSIL